MHCLNPLGARNISPSGLYLQRKTLGHSRLGERRQSRLVARRTAAIVNPS